ncbi:MAG: macro domain-containing protein [Kiritimatiellae bacterium]|nr:macro domain-containing protein [Kiritimatiellia bacterium]
MTTIKKGDLLAESAEALVNTVNCVGVMGRGVALQFKKRFPENFKAYERACKNGDVVPGKMFVFETGALFPRIIINFPTKRHWRQGSRMEDIEAGLADLVRVLRERGVSSVAVPPLGCGLGGLDWKIVRPKIAAALESVPGLSSVLFEPGAAPAPAVAEKAPKMSPGRAALIALVRRYLSGLLSPFITLLEIQKLLYFLQESGEPLRLNYSKQTYGPYAENLRHVLRAIEGHWLSGYADGGDAPTKELTLLPGAADLANDFLANLPDTQKRIERVARLVDGYEDSFGMELLATVHWVASKEGARTPEETVALVHGWNERKRQFSERQIEKARTRLFEQGWIKS